MLPNNSQPGIHYNTFYRVECMLKEEAWSEQPHNRECYTNCVSKVTLLASEKKTNAQCEETCNIPKVEKCDG
jgi:hypothetical protein